MFCCCCTSATNAEKSPLIPPIQITAQEGEATLFLGHETVASESFYLAPSAQHTPYLEWSESQIRSIGIAFKASIYTD